MKLRILVFIFLSSLGNIISGQTNFRPGFIITNDFDTINGFVDFRGDIRNSRICVFKNDSSTEPSIFSPNDIQGYRIFDGKFYVSRSIVKDSLEVAIFLEYLVDAITDLYYYRDNTGDHYFLQKEGEGFIELQNTQIEVSTPEQRYLTRSNRYKGILKATLSDCAEIWPDIDHAGFNHNDLIQIASDYHGYVCEGEDCIIYEKQLPAVILTYGPIIGMNYSSLKFVHDKLYSNYDFKSDFSVQGGFSLNVQLPRINEKLSCQLDIMVGNNYYYSDNKDANDFEVVYTDIHIHLTAIRSSLLLKYTYTKGKIRPSVFAGWTGNFLLKSNNERIVERNIESTIYRFEFSDAPLGDTFWGIQTGLGINYQIDTGKTLFMHGFYEYTQARYSETILTKINNVGLVLGIYFSR